MRHKLITVLGFLVLFTFGIPFLQMCSDVSLRPVLMHLASGILSLLGLYLVAVPNLQPRPLGRVGTEMTIGLAHETTPKERQVKLAGISNAQGKPANGHFSTLMAEHRIQ